MNNIMLGSGWLKKLTQVFREYPSIEQVILYGSRATGKATEISDIDLVIKGVSERQIIGRILLDIEELNFPVSCDLQAFESIQAPALIGHIEKVGQLIYQRGENLLTKE